MSEKLYDLQQASRVYVIGDIHGRLDLHGQVIAKIELDAGAHERAQRLDE